MNTQRLNRYIICLLWVQVVLMTACNKKSEDETTTAATTGGTSTTSGAATGRLMFHLHTYIGNTEVDGYNIVYTDESGRKLSLQLAQFYVTGIQLVRLDGSVYDVPDTRLLKLLDIATYVIGDVPAGNYQGVRFKIGLDSVSSTSDPLLSPDSAILNRPEMWFGTTALPEGYVWMHAKGRIDTTNNADGTMLQPFDYKIGVPTGRMQIAMPFKKYTVLPGGIEYTHILVDYSKLFTGVDLHQNTQLFVLSASDNATAWGAQVIANISSMFTYEE